MSVHGGETRPKPGHALATPIIQTATYTFGNTQEVRDHFDGKIERIDYGRYASHPAWPSQAGRPGGRWDCCSSRAAWRR
jgi:O-acetylhomoserine/O-acetylserine sulfhydrylase-like pyridoxal-dependent enzyme